MNKAFLALMLIALSIPSQACDCQPVIQPSPTKPPLSKYFTLTFQYACRPNVASQSCLGEVVWNDKIVLSIVPCGYGWNTFSLNVNARPGINILQFAGAGISDGQGLLIDNVTLVRSGSRDNIVVNGGFSNPYVEISYDFFNDIQGWKGIGIEIGYGPSSYQSGTGQVCELDSNGNYEISQYFNFDEQFYLLSNPSGISQSNLPASSAKTPSGSTNSYPSTQAPTSPSVQTPSSSSGSGNINPSTPSSNPSISTASNPSSNTLTSPLASMLVNPSLISSINPLMALGYPSSSSTVSTPSFTDAPSYTGAPSYVSSAGTSSYAPTMNPTPTPAPVSSLTYKLEFDWAVRDAWNLQTSKANIIWNDVIISSLSYDGNKNVHHAVLNVSLNVGNNVISFDGTSNSDAFGITIDNVKLTSAYNKTNLIVNGGFIPPTAFNDDWKYFDDCLLGWSCERAEVGKARCYNQAWGSSDYVIELDSDSNQRYSQTIKITQEYLNKQASLHTQTQQSTSSCNLSHNN